MFHLLFVAVGGVEPKSSLPVTITVLAGLRGKLLLILLEPFRMTIVLHHFKGPLNTQPLELHSLKFPEILLENGLNCIVAKRFNC